MWWRWLLKFLRPKIWWVASCFPSDGDSLATCEHEYLVLSLWSHHLWFQGQEHESLFLVLILILLFVQRLSLWFYLFDHITSMDSTVGEVEEYIRWWHEVASLPFPPLYTQLLFAVMVALKLCIVIYTTINIAQWSNVSLFSF